MDDELNELLDHFAQINKHEQLHYMEMEEKDMVPKTTQAYITKMKENKVAIK